MAMPTFSAGQRVTGAQLNQLSTQIDALTAATSTAGVTATDATSRTTTSTSYTGTLSPAGLCGVSFVAPQSGKVEIHWAAELFNDTPPNNARVSPAVRTGSTVGSGTVVLAASDARAVLATTVIRTGASMQVTGLTAGSTYNVSLEQRIFSGGTGTFLSREVNVVPLTA